MALYIGYPGFKVKPEVVGFVNKQNDLANNIRSLYKYLIESNEASLFGEVSSPPSQSQSITHGK